MDMMNEKIDKFAVIPPLQKKLIKLLKLRGFDCDETVLFVLDFRTDEDCSRIIQWIEEHPEAIVEDIVGESFRMRGLI